MGSDPLAAYPPHVLREYSLIADGQRGALLGPRGDVVWMCAPAWADDAVFSSLIGGSGVYAVTPTDQRYVWGGRYEDGTMIWLSRWVTSTGIVECRDALAYPGDPHTVVFLRRIIAAKNDAQVRVILDPRAQYGRAKMTELHHHGEVWTARCGRLWVRWSGAGAAHRHRDGWLELVIDVPEGQHYDLVLEISDRQPTQDPPGPDRTWTATEHAWHESVPELLETIAPDDARQSYAVLRGMTSADTGAMVAATTMSLPERANAGRSYDYRYAWIRDQCYAGQAVAACGGQPLLDEAVRFVSDRLLADGADLRPAYTVAGGRVPDEHDIHLPGYPGGRDIAGNWVNDQFQLDNFGESLLLLSAAARHDRLNLENWKAVEIAVDAIKKRWTEPDAGIWELHPAHWAHSRLICAAGLRAVSEQAPPTQGSEWTSFADTIVANTAQDCLHPSGRWQRTPEDDRVDASLLLPALRGALSPADPRSVTTLDAVRKDLGRQGYVYRFSQDPRPLADSEGAFLLCGFQMAMAVHQQGQATEAMRWFERNRAACGSPGLFTEEYDIDQRQLRGNYPQAFVHAMLVEASAALAAPPQNAT